MIVNEKEKEEFKGRLAKKIIHTKKGGNFQKICVMLFVFLIIESLNIKANNRSYVHLTLL